MDGCRVGYFIAASSVVYIVLVAWLLKPEPAAAGKSKGDGKNDGSLARQVRQTAVSAALTCVEGQIRSS